MKISAAFFISFFLCETCLASLQDDSVSDIFSKEAHSIVVVGAIEGKLSRIGSGFIVGSGGLIATNYHVIKKARAISVKLKNNKEYNDVEVINFDAAKDIALIKINESALNAVTLGDSNSVEIGQRVVTIGNPLGLEDTISDGLISSIRTTGGGVKLLQISVPLSGGSSGGPLFNLKGEVVGITTASYIQGQNLNFAVPINYLKPLLQKADYNSDGKKSGKRIFIARKYHRITIPLYQKEEKAFFFYMVRENDTLFSIAKRFGTSVDEIKRINKLKTTKIYTGQALKLPLTGSK
jgi:S1-C subfamily serine protease